MTNVDQCVPPTHLMEWYQKQEKKDALCRRISLLVDRSTVTVRLWMRGVCKPREKVILSILEQETGISKDKLFAIVE